MKEHYHSYILKGLELTSGEIIRRHLEDNGWELTEKIFVSSFYRNPKTNNYATLVDFTGTNYSKRLKNRLSITDDGRLVNELVHKLGDNIKVRLMG